MKGNLQRSLNSQQLWEDPYKSVSQSPKSDGSGKTVKKLSKLQHFQKTQMSFLKRNDTFAQWEKMSTFCHVYAYFSSFLHRCLL